MKIAITGKGGVGKTTITALFGDYLARLGKTVWMVDADTALSLGQASGLDSSEMPEPLIHRNQLLQERIRPYDGNLIHLNPQVNDLPDSLFVSLPLGAPPFAGEQAGQKRLLIMGTISNAGGGCACEANALLKALLAHLVLEREEWVLVDMEAGVEHLGRGTVAHVDQLLIVTEPSLRSLETAAEVGRMAKKLGLVNQQLVLNRTRMEQVASIPAISDLPLRHIVVPILDDLREQQLQTTSVLGLQDPSRQILDEIFTEMLHVMADPVKET